MTGLEKILYGLKFRTEGEISRVKINGIKDDSRQVGPQDAFIAVKGYAVDGTGFINDAIKNGASVIVAEEDFKSKEGVTKILVDDTRAALPVLADNFYGHPSDKLKVVGVTGTNGKTTITYLLESIIKKSGHEAGVIGTISYKIKGKEVHAKNTTPGALELQSMLADMAGGGVGYAIMEVSSHSLDQNRVERVHFDAAIFTNITAEHLDYHKTMDSYFKAKARLFDRLKEDGAAVLNVDDKKVASLKGKIKKNRVITYAILEAADVKAEDMDISQGGSVFTVKTPIGRIKIKTALIGKHNISNILAAIAASFALNIKTEAITSGIEAVSSVPGRLEAVRAGQPFKIFIDYAHTEDALYNILSILKTVAKKRVVTVFGCGGNRDRTKRPLMGRVACELSDRVIITSDNPRFEDPAGIIDEIEKGVKGKFFNYSIEPDRLKAIGKALKFASKDDIVVIAGKGHENYQIVKDKILPFDDREVVKKILKEAK